MDLSEQLMKANRMVVKANRTVASMITQRKALTEELDRENIALTRKVDSLQQQVLRLGGKLDYIEQVKEVAPVAVVSESVRETRLRSQVANFKADVSRLRTLEKIAGKTIKELQEKVAADDRKIRALQLSVDAQKNIMELFNREPV